MTFVALQWRNSGPTRWTRIARSLSRPKNRSKSLSAGTVSSSLLLSLTVGQGHQTGRYRLPLASRGSKIVAGELLIMVSLPCISRPAGTRSRLTFSTATYLHSLHSPPLSHPMQFRGSLPEDACEHSECFFFSYDIHRSLANRRRPCILMNPKVQVTYTTNWYQWHTEILRLPFVKFWLSESDNICARQTRNI